MPIPEMSEIMNAKSKRGGRNIRFITVCAWCGKIMGEKSVWRDDPDAPDEVSHGICKDCERKIMGEDDKR